MFRVLTLLVTLSLAGLLAISNTGMVVIHAYTVQRTVMVGALVAVVFVLGFAAGASLLSLFKHGTSATSKKSAASSSFAYKNPSNERVRASASSSREIQYE